ncbi:MAG: AEC family transporter, partial [Nanoarchaeota archaeon]|nr:AEC family transporter [Nanoarchaeota archaeon]MBU2443721.1 AEC family transporter [Nanoarchaeota archaeon]
MNSLFVLLFFFAGILFRYLFPHKVRFRNYLNKYLIYFALPLLVFLSVSGTDVYSMGRYVLISGLIGVLLVVLMYFLVWRLKLSKKEKASLFLCSAFGNTAFLGIPLSFVLFGDVGARVAGIFSFVLIFFHFTIGVFLANKYVDNKNSTIVGYPRPKGQGITLDYLKSRIFGIKNLNLKVGVLNPNKISV